MKGILLLINILCSAATMDAQLLSRAPQFPNDNSIITITVDAANGNHGTVSGSATISGNPVVAAPGNQKIVAELVLSGISYYDTIKFYLPPGTIVLDLLPGVKEGINYWSGCDSVTLVLYAPNKTNAVDLGDFLNNNRVPQTQFQMNKTPDGNYYWLTIHDFS